MASENTQPRPAGAGPPGDVSQQRFEKELQDLAAEAKADDGNQIIVYAKIIILLGLLGAYSNASQLVLAPVYGTIPSSIYHSTLLMAGCFAGWAGNLALRRVSLIETVRLLPVIAICVPTIQYFLCGYSEVLGLPWGPLVTEGLTLFPLAFLTASNVAENVEQVDTSMLPEFLQDSAPGVLSWVALKVMEAMIKLHLQWNMGTAFLYTRMGLEMLLSACYSIFAPSKYLAYTIPALLHTALLNTHVLTAGATASLNSTLAADGWLLMERRESVTGYISVIDNVEKGFRVMRCDHSILGGEWTMFEGEKVQEPIYGVFAMLEAVRLVETATHVADSDAKALVIGLGIGTTPSALVLHGINTTVVEIDPVVYELAVKYFHLQENNKAVIADATYYTSQLLNQSTQMYDYIVHDVFTGGAEPVDLFTLEFLQRLSALLTPGGVIAINYAGDFSLPAPKTIVRTILEVFPTCRIFRESPDEVKSGDAETVDFTNMVIFCTKTSDSLTFRRAVEADYLRSHARQLFLEPKHEVPLLDLLSGDDVGVMRESDTGNVTEWHKTSAAGHWAVMRTVLPAKIWERW